MSEPSRKNSSWNPSIPESERDSLLRDLCQIEHSIAQQIQERENKRRAVAAAKAAKQSRALLEY